MPLTESEDAQAQKTIRDAEERMRGITDSYFREKTGEDITGPAEVTGEEPTVDPSEKTEEPPEKKEPEVAEPTEKVVEPIAEPEKKEVEPMAAAEPTVAAGEEPDEEEKEIDSLSLGKNAHPKSQKVLKFLQTKAKEAIRKAKQSERATKEREAEIERLKALKLLDEETEKELEEGREFRRRVEIEHDPAINEKYSKGQEALQVRAMAILQTHGLPPSTAQYIKESGGIFSFMSSNDLMPKDRVVGADGKALDNTTHKQFFEKFIAPALSVQDAKTLSELDRRSTKLYVDRDDELSSAKTKTADFFKGREEQMKKGREEWIGKVRSGALKQVADFGVKLIEVPVKTSPAEKEKIDKLNAEYKQAEGIAQRVLESPDPEEMGRMAVVYANYQTRFKREMAEKDASIANLKARAEAAEQKLNNIKNAGKTPHTSAPTEIAKPKTNAQIKDPGERMAAMMSEGKK